MMLDKYATVFKTKSKVNDLILAHINNISDIRNYIEQLLANPTEENAQLLDSHFNKAASMIEEIRNSIITLVKASLSEDGSVEEVDVKLNDDGSFEL
jgi:hypothetical protein